MKDFWKSKAAGKTANRSGFIEETVNPENGITYLLEQLAEEKPPGTHKKSLNRSGKKQKSPKVEMQSAEISRTSEGRSRNLQNKTFRSNLKAKKPLKQ